MNAPSVTTTTFAVKGMHCSGCAARISLTLEEQPGVQSAWVDLKGERVSVAFDSTATTPQQLATALAADGYTLVVS